MMLRVTEDTTQYHRLQHSMHMCDHYVMISGCLNCILGSLKIFFFFKDNLKGFVFMLKLLFAAVRSNAAHSATVARRFYLCEVKWSEVILSALKSVEVHFHVADAL